jgi:biopolymer transport protein ExbD
MKFNRQRAETEGINLTPLIDVVFLLLIFFMVSTSFTKETHLNIDIPQAVGEPTQEIDDGIDIVLGADGSIAINGRALVNDNLDTLKTALREVSGDNNKLPLSLTADAKTAHEHVVRVMDAAGQLGFSRLSVTTRRPESE